MLQNSTTHYSAETCGMLTLTFVARLQLAILGEKIEEENDSLMDETLNDNSLDTIESTLDLDDSRDSGMYALK
ncbi:hypothetical protein TNIN_287001 [Trichonephila inaurata madagascariensis]|uniref:Uncharacterized protein n=1 Tax=Trichonephila inaurata madagascariensis TaxID=2747483 RepID=A0A8X6XXJ4_9ARAC|nr:hypothetical protein TNIN_287001 [Trichonephila inaurata madagascariensis]